MALPKPPSCANCMSVTTPAAPGAPSTQQATTMLKASDGKMRIDYPNMSVITNPAAQHAMVLDHLKQQVKIVPLQPQLPNAPSIPGMPHMPALPQIPGAPHPAVMNVKDLGKSMIGGHPVEGKQYTMQMPTLPALPKAPSAQLPKLPGAPAMPQVPGMPKAPGMPQAPGMPKAPAAPQLPKPTVAEVWSSSVTGLPVLSKMSGEFGQHTMSCQTAPVPEPHPSMFQPPPNYKFIK